MNSLGYCRFQNAVEDMLEYTEHLNDIAEEDMSKEWQKARHAFVNLCGFVAHRLG